jgi:hypothetical protein
MGMDMNMLTQDLTTNVTSDLTSKVVTWFLVPSLVFTVLLLAVIISSSVRRRRVENAIFEIRDLLEDILDTQLVPANSTIKSQKNTGDDTAVPPDA